MLKPALVLWKFSRPHTIIGTALSIFALYTLVSEPHGFSTNGLWAIGLALIWATATNIYVVGINQVRDVEVDKINKPALPIAAGILSRKGGTIISVGMGLLAMGIALTQATGLLISCGLAVLLASAYSLPPLHLKKHPFWAALCISIVRGPIINLSGYYYFTIAAGYEASFPPIIWVLTLFMFGFSFVIAWYKDIPDLEGDRRHEVKTLAVRLGPEVVFCRGLYLLALCYLFVIVAFAFGIEGANASIVIVFHACALAALLYKAKNTDPTHQKTIANFYQFIWRLFYAEYICFIIAALTA